MGATARALMGGMLACAVSLGLGRFAFTPLLPLMQAEAGFDTQAAGVLAAANNLGYLIGAVWAGWVRTDLARHRLLALGLMVLLATMAGMAATPSMAAWNGLRLAAGIASAWVFVLASALVVPRLAELGHARLAGLHFGGVGAGIVVAGGPIAWIGEAAGSGAGWLAATAIAATLALLSWPALRDAHPKPGTAAAPPPAVAYPLGMLAAAYFCEGLGYIVTGTFLVAVVKQSPTIAHLGNLSWVMVGLAAVPSALAWSWLAERKGYVPALIAAHLVQAAGMALPALSSHPAAVLAGAVCYGATFLGIVGMALALGRAITPAAPARAMALLTAVFGIGQIIGPLLAAALADWGGWPAALGMAAAVVLAGAPLLWLGGRIAR
ncbi:YbfB/YjiJ family MFS transporter [Magnetospirillum sp. UT-4]|uniref:YbfB/YjiJ family MFS transporter n=1 Tax=Magnetospirillum sp. UT-4 TaxID=2681467 RepID=UPI0013821052|nr:YbfB/YjiJ family MFS transporter [Magnetospirillum sp. UT-4]CAA7620705.1 putative major facilitator superfamily, general substrate transporter [Magnetospirillum sp. UT-4]